ncbi:hypothetical protein [Halobacteriovorax sp. JY17]|uniref:hypothetical protein n=1 Tax=Halobacteriovorax sp. JY17 TaxID=2014617 RepID=UPI000C632399|nr:hypothetical protein [Halobacteriovorax sp. JY17]PIK15353.1 MAG: hypothetical protein CES88_01160 [Halobacteriovorax sp. JY17]
MNSFSIISYFFILSLFISCVRKSPVDTYEVGQCFKESHSNYASYVSQDGRIYRIDGLTDKTLKVSIWYSQYWLYQGEKKGNYFINRSNLLYEETNCPGSRKSASITDKIQGINLR